MLERRTEMQLKAGPYEEKTVKGIKEEKGLSISHGVRPFCDPLIPAIVQKPLTYCQGQEEY